MIHIRIPATTANVGPGFDTFGMALSCYNYLSCEESDKLFMSIQGEGKDTLSFGKNHLAVRSAQQVYNLLDAGDVKLTFNMINNIPISRGLGSSSAVIVGGIMAANIILGAPLNTEKLLNIAASIEGHPDNVAPALLGGFVASCYEDGKLYTERFEPPRRLKAVAVIPDLEIKTLKARTELPINVPFEDAVFNLSHASLLAISLMNGNLTTFSKMLKDKLHQTQRLRHIPGAHNVIKAAEEMGALGCVISGSGSTMIAYTVENEKEIVEGMQEAFGKAGINSKTTTLSIDNDGAKIISNNAILED